MRNFLAFSITVPLIALCLFSSYATAETTKTTSVISTDIDGILAACKTSHQSIYLQDTGNTQIVRVDPLTDEPTNIALPSEPRTFALSADGLKLYVGMMNNAIIVFDISTLPETEVETIQLTIPPIGLAVSPMGDVWVETGQGITTDLYCYDSQAQTTAESTVVSGRRLRTSPDGTMLLHHSSIGGVLISGYSTTDHCSLNQISQSNFNFGSGTYDARWSPDSTRIYVVNGVTNVVATAPVSSASLTIDQNYLPFNSVAPIAIAPTQDGSLLALVTFKYDGRIPGDLIDLTTGDIIDRFQLHGYEFFGGQEEKLMVANCNGSVASDGSARSWGIADLKLYSVVSVTTSLAPPIARLEVVDYTPNGTLPPTPTPTPGSGSLSLAAKALAKKSPKLRCKVTDNNGLALVGTTITAEVSAEEDGTYESVLSKASNGKGLAIIPLRKVKKGWFARCTAGENISNSVKVKKKKKKKKKKRR